MKCSLVLMELSCNLVSRWRRREDSGIVGQKLLEKMVLECCMYFSGESIVSKE